MAQLITQRQPPWPRVMPSPKYLHLPPTGTHSLDKPVYLVWLPRGLTHLGDDHIRVEPAVAPGGELEVALGVPVRLDADKHVLFGVV